MKKCFLTAHGPKAVGPYSTATLCGDTVYLSGMIGIDPKVNKLVEGGIEAEARQVFENIHTVLGELNLTCQSVLKTTVFLTDLGNFGKVNELYAGYFGPDYPARSCLEISKLPLGAAIEVELIAEIQ